MTTLAINEALFVPVEENIIIDGKRYGIVKREQYFDHYDRKTVTKWKAIIDTPEMLDYMPGFYGDSFGYVSADTREEAIQLAAEAFAESYDENDEDGRREIEKVGKALFKNVPVAIDIFEETAHVG